MMGRVKLPFARPILAQRWFPVLVQTLVLFFFGFIIYSLFAGPVEMDDNFGSLATWILWWPGLAILFFLAGRVWCAVCPFSLISDFVKKLTGNRFPVPLFLKRYGAWVIIGLFLILTWSELTYDLVHIPHRTGILLLCIVTAVVASGAFFERRTWCRYMCPLGGIAGLYSRLGLVALRGDRNRCATCEEVTCYKGIHRVDGCPLFEVVRVMDSNTNCSLCGQCVKACPYEAIDVSLRRPGQELLEIRRPRIEEAVLAFGLAGLIFLLDALERFEPFFERIGWIGGAGQGLGYFVLMALFLGAAVSAGFLVAAGAARLGGETWKLNFLRAGYAFIPLVLSMHISHTGTEFLEDGGYLLPGLYRAFGHVVAVDSASLLGAGGILGFRVIAVLCGLALSLWVGLRILPPPENVSRWKTAWPVIVALLVAAGLNLSMLFMGEG